VAEVTEQEPSHQTSLDISVSTLWYDFLPLTNAILVF